MLLLSVLLVPFSLSFLSLSSSPQTVELKAVSDDSVFWRRGVRKHVNWWFDCRAIAATTEHGRERELYVMSPSSGSLGPGQSICLMVSIIPEAITAGEKCLKHTNTHDDDGLLYLILPAPLKRIHTHVIVNTQHFFSSYRHTQITPSQFVSIDPFLPAHTYVWRKTR